MNLSFLVPLFRCVRRAGLLSLLSMAAAAPLDWNLPAQPAAEALQAFSRHSGWQVLFSARELAGITSRPVQGEHEPLAALDQLLEGTPFESVPTGEKRVVVRARPLSRVSGLVLAGEAAEPLPGATVELEGTGLSAVTGRGGRFQLLRVPAGTYALVVRAEGLATFRLENIAVTAGTRVELRPITLGRDGATATATATGDMTDTRPLFYLEDMVVTPSRFGIADGPGVPGATLTHDDLELLPQLGEDLYRAIGRLPGLATVDYSAKFWMRGAPNEQVLARLDGLTLLEPYHIKDVDGALAIIDLETVSRLDLTSGGFTAEYGDRLAGVLRMETATHRGTAPHTTLGLSLTGLRATRRGASADGKRSWMISGRMGYPDIALDTANADDADEGEIKPRYYDVFAKFEYEPAPGQVFGLHVLHADDDLTVRETNGRNLANRYGNSHLWARWRADYPGGAKGETVLAHSRLDWQRDGTGWLGFNLPFELSDDRDLRLTMFRSDWSVPTAERGLLRTGVEVQSGSAGYEYRRLRSFNTIRDGALTVERRRLDLSFPAEGMNNGGYAALRMQPADRLTVEPGLRYDWSDYGPADGGWSPRFNAALNLGRSTLVRAAWGLYRQQQGLHEINVADGESAAHSAEEAEHRVVGLETILGRGVNLRLEAYQRVTRDPRPHGENLVEVSDVLGEVLPDRVFLRPSHAEASGVELILEGRGRHRVDWALSYALARTVETIDGREVPRERDQRHTFHVDVSWRPNSRWQFTASWQYHTGWPTTAVDFGHATLADGKVIVTRSYGPVNGERLPDYHRLDLRATRIFRLKHGTLRAYVDVFNAYDRENVSNFNSAPHDTGSGLITRRSNEKLFPLLPSVGFIWDF